MHLAPEGGPTINRTLTAMLLVYRYGNRESVVWMQTELPPGFSFPPHLAQTYHDSGWCYVEEVISAAATVGTRRLDLSLRGRLRDWCGVRRYGGQFQFHKTLQTVCAARRQPPVPPKDVQHALETTKTFTGKGDLPVVIDLYSTYYHHVASTLTALVFADLEWGAQEAELLGQSLPDFVACRTLE